MEEVITDFEDMDFSEVIQEIKEKCNLTDLIICKVEEDSWHKSTSRSNYEKEILSL